MYGKRERHCLSVGKRCRNTDRGFSVLAEELSISEFRKPVQVIGRKAWRIMDVK